MGAFLLSESDRRFLALFESCELDPAAFDHRAHLRLAYACLAGGGTDDAHARVRRGLLRFLDAHGIDPAKYHETLTRAWILAVRHFMARTDGAQSADAFLERNPELLDSRIMLTHYSREALFSEDARSRFVRPDLDPIPRHDDGGAGPGR